MSGRICVALLVVTLGARMAAAEGGDARPELDPALVARAQAELERYTAEAEAEAEALSEEQAAAVAAITDLLDDARAYLRVRQADSAGTCFISARKRFADLDPALEEQAPKVLARLRARLDALAQDLLRDEQLDPDTGTGATPADEEPASPSEEAFAPAPAPQTPERGSGAAASEDDAG